MPEILLVNGPNLKLLGTRQSDIYGHDTLADIEARVTELARRKGWSVSAIQSHHEGELIDFLENHRNASGAIVNPGALMMAGWSLRDALESFPAPWIEVHISNIWEREAFRHNSILSALASGVIVGAGVKGYELAVRAIIEQAGARTPDQSQESHIAEPLTKSDDEQHTLDLVRSIWADVLECPVDSVTDDANFFALGGTSSLAFTVNTVLEDRLDGRLPEEGIPISAIAEQPSLLEFADCIDQVLASVNPRTEAPLMPEEGVI